MTKTLSTVAACKLAGLDRARLNEMIHADIYKSAPSTRAGAGRRFGQRDIVHLLLFAELRRAGFTAERAGELVARVAAGYGPTKCSLSLAGLAGVESLALSINLGGLRAMADNALREGAAVGQH